MSRAIKPGKIERGRARILVSGPSSSGKTYGLCGFPNCKYIDSEDGARSPQYQRQLEACGSVYLGKGQGAQDISIVLDEIKELSEMKSKLTSLVIDSLSKLFGQQIATDYERMMLSGRAMDKTFGAEKKGAIGFVRRLIRWADLTDKNLILVCHEKDKWKDNEVVGTTFDGWDKLEYEFDLWLRINNRKAIVKKTRYEEFPLGESFEWNYQEFAARYGVSSLECPGHPEQLATLDQILELSGLIELLKLPEETTNKWLDKCGAESWDDMTSVNIEKCLQGCKDQIAKASGGALAISKPVSLPTSSKSRKAVA